MSNKNSIILLIIGLFLTIPSPAQDGMALWFWLLDKSIGEVIPIKEGWGGLFIPMMLFLPMLVSYIYVYIHLPKQVKLKLSIAALGVCFLWYAVIVGLYRLIPWLNILTWLGLLVFEISRELLSKVKKERV